MKKKLYNGTFYYKKDIGRVRILNEDDTKIVVNAKSNVLMIVTDGMGGTSKGDYASLTTINTIVDSFKRHNGFLSLYTAKRWLISSAKRANRYIYATQYKNKTYKEMGTTLVCALIYKDKLICLNVGDSRLYLYNNHELSQVFEDQTYVNYLYHSGQIAEKEVETHPNRHVITNAIGLFPSLSYDLKVLNYKGEKILLCSDGLYNNVNMDDVLNILRTNDSSEEKVKMMINLANFNGGSDNISVALWEAIDD